MLGKKSLKKYPLIYFIVLSYLLHFILIKVMISQLSGSITIFAYHLAAWSPNISAIIVLGFIIKDRFSIRKLLEGWTKWRVNVTWYFVALLPLAVGFISAGIYYLTGGTTPDFSSSASTYLMGLLMCIITGATGEELGWRGFVLPRIQSKYGALSSSILVGLIWAGWHIPYWPIPGWFPKMQSIPFLAFTLQSIAKSVIMTWMYNNTKGSVLIASLFHLVLNYSLFLGVLPSSPLPMEPIIISTITWLVIAVIVVIVFGSTKLSRKSNSEMPFRMVVNER
jgi:membrane protease YdiL (CAAX protease family)